MTRESMARTLREFQQAGCIRVESGIISILAWICCGVKSVRLWGRLRCTGFLGLLAGRLLTWGHKSRYFPHVILTSGGPSFPGELL